MSFNFASKPATANTFSTVNANQNANFGGGFGTFGSNTNVNTNTNSNTFGLTTPSTTNAFGSVSKQGVMTTGFGGFGNTSGFNNTSNQLQQQQQSQQQQQQLQQQFPYHGIKGPGYNPSWQQNVDFTQLSERALFETLPIPLQQHLTELRLFMNVERAAKERVFAYFNETNLDNNNHSYRHLLKCLSTLQFGNDAIDHTVMSGREQARRQIELLCIIEQDEKSMKEYELEAWENVRRSYQMYGFHNSSTSANDTTRYSNYNNLSPYLVAPHNQLLTHNKTSYNFDKIVADLDSRVSAINEQIEQLRIALDAPPINRHNKTKSDKSNTLQCTVNDVNKSNAEFLCQNLFTNLRKLMVGQTNCNTFGVEGSMCTSVLNQYMRNNRDFIINSDLSSDKGSSDVIFQLNSILRDEIASITTLTNTVAELHARCTLARELFIQHYGTAEGQMLFKPFPSAQQQYLHHKTNGSMYLNMLDERNETEKNAIELERKIAVTSPLYSAASPTAPVATMASQALQQQQQQHLQNNNVSTSNSTLPSLSLQQTNLTANVFNTSSNTSTLPLNANASTILSAENTMPVSTASGANNTVPASTASPPEQTKHVEFTFPRSTEEDVARPARRTREGAEHSM